jgi:hypothetical protein
MGMDDSTPKKTVSSWINSTKSKCFVNIKNGVVKIIFLGIIA